MYAIKKELKKNNKLILLNVINVNMIYLMFVCNS